MVAAIDPNSIELITDESYQVVEPMESVTGSLSIDPASIELEEPEGKSWLERGVEAIGGPIYEHFEKKYGPAVKAITTAGASLGLMPGAGVRGAIELIPTVSPDPDKLIEPGSLTRANKRFEEVMGFPTKLIKTPEEAKAVEHLMLISKPFEWAGEGGRWVGYGLNWALRELGLPTDLYLEPIFATAGEAAAIFFGPKLVKSLKGSTAFRRLTVPERGIVVQSLVDAKKANPGMTEGELLRRYNNEAWFDEALKAREIPKAEEVVRAEGPEFVERQAPAAPPATVAIDPASIEITPPGFVPTRQALPELEIRGRLAKERPSISEPVRPEYMRPPSEESVIPGPPPPQVERLAPTTPMRELKQRMGYDDLGNKIRDFQTMSPDQQTRALPELTEDLDATIVSELPDAAEYAKVMMDAAEKVKLPDEVRDRLEMELRPLIKLKDLSAGKLSKSLAEHKARGDIISEFAGFTATWPAGRTLIAISMNTPDTSSIPKTVWHEMYHVASRQLLPDDVYAKQMEHFGNNEENAADAFAEYIRDKTSETSKAQPSWLKKTWDQVIELLTRIKEWALGKKYDQPGSVFRDIAEGKFSPRDIISTRGELAAAARPVDFTRPARAREYGYTQKVGYPRSYKGETLEEYETRIKTPAPKQGTEVEGAVYQGETEPDIIQQIPVHEWIDSETGLPFTTDTPDAASVAAEVKRLRSDELQFSTFDKSRKTINVAKDIENMRFGKVRQEFKNIRESFLDPNTDSPLDRSGAAFLRTRKYADYVAEMPDIGELKPNEIFRFDPDSGKLMAVLTTKGGKIKPALRQSGFYASQRFVDAFADFDPETNKYTLKAGIQDVSKTAEQTMDPTRFIQLVDQGFFGGPAQQYILWPTRMTTLAKIAYSDDHKIKLANISDKYRLTRGKDRKAVGDIIEFIYEKDAWADDSEGLARRGEVKDFLEGYSTKRRIEIVDAAKDLRKQFTQVLRQVNMARRKRKQPEIPFLKGYRPHVMEQSLKSRLLGTRMTPETVMQKPEMPDFIQPNKPFNPREMARTGGLEGYLKERDAVTLMTDYIETAAKDIFDTNIVHNNKIYAATLRSLGLENAAAGLERYTSEVFAGTTPRLTRAVRTVVPEVPLRMLYGFRRNLTRAVFPLNWTWNTFIQTSSAGLTYVRYGNKANLAGLQYMFDPAIRQAVKQNIYSSIIKSRWGGKAAYQDVQGSILKNRRLQSSKLDTVEEYANFMTSAVEDALTGHAVVAAYYHGRKLGLTGRALWEYASEGGAKTQSMYNFQDQPGFLRNKEVGAIAPFQTYAFEVFNTIRETNLPVVRGVVGKAGTYQTFSAGSKDGKSLIRKRLMILARLTAAIMITNAVVEKTIGRKPWVPSSFLPFLKYVVGESWSWGGRYGMGPEIAAPQQYVKEFKEGVYNLLKHGSFKKFRKWLVRYHIPAGIQVNRVVDGLQAIADEGTVRDVSGGPMFKIDPDEYWKAVVSGPYATTAGRAHIEKLEGKKKKKKGKKKTRREILSQRR